MIFAMHTRKSKAKKGLGSGKTAVEVGFARRTITLPPALDDAVSAIAGPRGFSAFVQEAVAQRLQRERIAEWLDERLAARGGEPLPAEAVEFARRAWRNRKSS
jgi:hypothetical protein